ncbi:transposase [Paenibacillus sp. S150]|uniref:IS66 family transposase n=1 Tax=Paenibacillus sp. S150 TaxID=2749826 RepID=UPI001C58D19B|nr:transposase [Paenibacillus sp. S150]MBW4080689.1 transposase [Paenibacillus sp. S150]
MKSFGSLCTRAPSVSLRWRRSPPSRRQAVKEEGILPVYTGCVIHDSRLAMYFRESFPYSHGLCGVHLIRECQGIVDNDGHLWATDMKARLQKACHLSKEAKRQAKPLTEAEVALLEQRYDEILQEGPLEWSPPKRSKLKKGKQKQTKAASLGNRMIACKLYILRFLHDAYIPFDNNQAERDLRMVKVKQKISGSIRNLQGAVEFARIRSLISSLRKQSRPLLPSLLLAIQGQFSFS